MEQPTNPFAKSITHRNNPDTFKTTYGTSYKQLSTIEASPVYEKMRMGDLPPEMMGHFPVDLNPYPMARDNYPTFMKRPYQPVPFDDELEFQRQSDIREERSRFEDSTLRRDAYREPLPANRHGGKYDQLESYEHDQRRERGRQEMPTREREEYQRQHQYDDLLAYKPEQEKDQWREPGREELEHTRCDKCDRDGVCMNRLVCNHKYCDNCLKTMHGSDNPFRDSIRWHYCCGMPGCNKWTADPKLVRTDPYGRRLVKFHDVGYFKTS